MNEQYLRERELDRLDVLARFKKANPPFTERDKLYREADGKCAICGSLKKGRNHSLDPCHKTNKLRGILCSKCNTGIGMFDDDTDRMRAAIAYLERNR